MEDQNRSKQFASNALVQSFLFRKRDRRVLPVIAPKLVFDLQGLHAATGIRLLQISQYILIILRMQHGTA